MNYLNRTILHFAVGVLAGLLLQALPLQGQQFEWAAQMGGTRFDSGNGVAVDASGNVYTTGSFSETVDFDPGPGVFNLTADGSSDAFVTKLDSAGNLVWARQFSGVGLSVAVDAAGNVYTTGLFSGTGDFDPGAGFFNLDASGQSAPFVTKLDSAGRFVWAKTMGGGDPSWGASVAVDVSGNVYVTGFFAVTRDFDPGPEVLLLATAGAEDIFVTKLDTNGNLVWVRTMGGPGSDQGNGVAVDGSGNVYVTGEFRGTADFGPSSNGGPLVGTSAGGSDIFVVKLDSAGNSVWAQTAGGSSFDQGTSVALDASGNVYTSGTFFGTAAFRSRPTGGGGFFLVTFLVSAGESDIFVTKWSTTGTPIWTRQMGGPNDDVGKGVALDNDGNVYTIGEFRAKADFDPSANVSKLTSTGNSDIFLNKLDNDGKFDWVRHLGGGGDNRGNGVAVDGGGNIYTTGQFKVTAYFDLDLGGVFSGGGSVVAGRLNSFGSSDIFVAKFHDPSAAGPLPLISEGGIVLATLLPTVSTISPRSIISVFGQNFSPGTTLFPNLDGNGNLARTLGGTCLEMNGERLPIFAMTPTQINAQTSAVQALGSASFRVITNCNTSNALLSEPATLTPRALTSGVEMTTVETATPGFFLFPPLADDGLIAARFNDDAVAVAPAGLFSDQFGPSRPARPGDIIVMYGTGWGPTEAALGTGQLATGAAQLLSGANPLVNFGGFFLAPQDVFYVGVTPNTAGLYQLAIRVPSGAQTGNHQVVLTVYGKSTPVGPVVPVKRP